LTCENGFRTETFWKTNKQRMAEHLKPNNSVATPILNTYKNRFFNLSFLYVLNYPVKRANRGDYLSTVLYTDNTDIKPVFSGDFFKKAIQKMIRNCIGGNYYEAVKTH